MTRKRLPAKRRKRARADDTKESLLLAGVVFAGAFDFLSGLEAGKPTVQAAKDTIRRSKRRIQALAEVEQMPDEDDDEET